MRPRPDVGALGVPADQVSGHGQPLEILGLERRFAVSRRELGVGVAPGPPAEGRPASIERVKSRARQECGAGRFGISLRHGMNDRILTS